MMAMNNSESKDEDNGKDVMLSISVFMKLDNQKYKNAKILD